MSEYGDALARYKLENNLSCKDIERKVGVSSSQIGLIIGGSTSSEALKKKISDGLGGILEEYINYKECSVCSKPFVSNMKSSETCSVECSTKRNKERCKITKKETMADRLIEYRKNAGIDQKQLAELIGVTKVTVKNLENCEKYSDETAKKIFDALGNKFKKFLKPSVCQCGKVFYKRRDVMKFCSAECSKKYYKPDAEALAKYKATQNEAFKAVRGKRKAIMEKHSISSFMDGMQYGDRQKEYLLNLQKTQRMEICRFWYAYQIGDKGRYSFKLHGQFEQGLKVGDELQELFDGKRIVYRVLKVDSEAKIYGVNYAYEEI